MNKCKMFIQKHIRIIALFILFVLIFIVIGTTYDYKSIKKFENSTYSLKYHNSWKITDKNNNHVTLKYSDDSYLDISVTDLEESYKYDSIENLFDIIFYNIKNQNSSYKFIAKEEVKITNNEYDGYKLLFEKGESQALLYIAKKGDQLLVASYYSNSKEFDILLDSVQYIVFNFKIKDEPIFLDNSIEKINTKKINWNKSEVSSFKEKTEHEVANQHFYVKYEMPKEFVDSSFNTTYNNLTYLGLKKGSIKATTTVSPFNIYEYIGDKEIKREINYLKKNTTKYKDIVVENEKLDSDYNSYVYKLSYTYIGTTGNIKYEKVYLIYELDYTRTFVILIEAKDTSVSIEMVDNVKLISSLKYADFIKRDVTNNNLNNVMKKYISEYSTTDKSYYNVNLTTPINYREVDMQHNKYESRYFVLDYNEELDFYKYNIKYKVSSFSIESSVNSTLKVYDYRDNASFKNNGTKILNGKTFEYYEGSYITSESGKEINVKDYYLFYTLEKGGSFIIEINVKDAIIENRILDELTKFDISIK